MSAVKRKHTFFALVIFLIGVGPLQAATRLFDSNGFLSGAENVLVSGYGVYDVSFLDGTCAAVYSGCDDLSDFAFNDEMAAVAASQAILDQVVIGPILDDTPGLTRGCNTRINILFCQISTVFGPSDSDPLDPATPAAEALNYAFGYGPDRVRSGGVFTFTTDTTSAESYVRARWTEVNVPPISAIPLPLPPLLLLTAIASLLALSRRARS